MLRRPFVCSFGRTPGISLPSAAGHQDVIRKAYKRGKLDPQRTDYVEVRNKTFSTPFSSWL